MGSVKGAAFPCGAASALSERSLLSPRNAHEMRTVVRNRAISAVTVTPCTATKSLQIPDKSQWADIGRHGGYGMYYISSGRVVEPDSAC